MAERRALLEGEVVGTEGIYHVSGETKNLRNALCSWHLGHAGVKHYLQGGRSCQTKKAVSCEPVHYRVGYQTRRRQHIEVSLVEV